MAERCQKVVLRFAGFLCRNFFRFKFAAPNLIGDVACDFGKAANFPGVITERGDDNFGFEGCSVLADTQALITNVSTTGSFAQIALWFPGGNGRTGFPGKLRIRPSANRWPQGCLALLLLLRARASRTRASSGHLRCRRVRNSQGSSEICFISQIEAQGSNRDPVVL
jgi:hypothetical protein